MVTPRQERGIFRLTQELLVYTDENPVECR
jgi:hypothetical protein